MSKHQVIYVIGVSGSGKSTIGKMLADQLAYDFFDADDFHPEINILKMSKGQALNDEDRKDWLTAINDCAIKNSEDNGTVVACSALKKKYRDTLSDGLEKAPVWVYLKGSYEVINDRMKKREDHFMPASLLKSQFDTMEVPRKSIRVNVEKDEEAIVFEIIEKLEKAD